MKRAKVVAVGLAACLSFATLGCSGTPQQTADTGEASEKAAVVGGWTVNTDATSVLTAQQQDVFDAATAQLVGVDYEPVAVIGQQVVAGTNHAFLCKTTPVTPEGDTGWSVVVVYEDLSGNSSFTSAHELAIDDVKTFEGSGDAVGAWVGCELDAPATLPEGADEAFEEAVSGLSDADPKLQPVALLGSQVVSGANYLVLCEGTEEVGDSARANPYVAIVYRNATGSSEITSLEQLDLAFYTTEDPVDTSA